MSYAANLATQPARVTLAPSPYVTKSLAPPVSGAVDHAYRADDPTGVRAPQNGFYFSFVPVPVIVVTPTPGTTTGLTLDFTKASNSILLAMGL